MWVTRDKNNALKLWFNKKPVFSKDKWILENEIIEESNVDFQEITF